MPVIDLATTPLREFNRSLHNIQQGSNDLSYEVANPRGSHAVAVGSTVPSWSM